LPLCLLGLFPHSDQHLQALVEVAPDRPRSPARTPLKRTLWAALRNLRITKVICTTISLTLDISAKISLRFFSFLFSAPREPQSRKFLKRLIEWQRWPAGNMVICSMNGPVHAAFLSTLRGQHDVIVTALWRAEHDLLLYGDRHG
jgi:hypothetical protein